MADPRKNIPRPPKPISHPEFAQIDQLHPYPGNPRKGNLEVLKESLSRNGQYRPIVVNRATLQVLAGNHTLQAAEDLGWTQIAVTYVDVDDEQAARIVLVDNRSNDLAGYDNEALADLLSELPDLDGTGYDVDGLDALLAELDLKPIVYDDPPPPPRKARTQPGDLIELGEHKLLCGDARDPDAYRKLLGECHADLIWSDPPYGVDYEGKTDEKLRIEGDGKADLASLLANAFRAADRALRPGAPIYVAHPGGERALIFGSAFLESGWSLRQTLVWLKDSIVLGHCDYHYRHELILYGFKPGPGRLGRGGPAWKGDDAQSSVLEFERPKASREHPTMKPPELIEYCLRNSSSPGELVLDPFAGSGSTLVACEKSKRAARLIELDPRFCDVICDRYQSLTGNPVK